MDIPTYVIWLAMIVTCFYALGFSITLWRDKNKTGAIAIFILAVAIIVTPFFQILK